MSRKTRHLRCPVSDAEGKIEGCGFVFEVSLAKLDEDADHFADCPRCGMFFDPDHPNSQPQPGNQACPMPGDPIGRRTCIASCHYFEAGNDPEHPDRGDEYLVLLLNGGPPYFKVAIITPDGDGDGWRILDEVNHHNIVPAVNGDHPHHAGTGQVDRRTGIPGYVDMGGDF